MTQLLNYIAEHFDLPILDWIAQNLRCAFLDTVMPVITALGDAGIFWIAAAVILLCLPKHRRTGLAMGIAMALGLLICNILLKPLVARIRPYDYKLEHFGITIQLLIAKPHDFSFPSGHTAVSFEAATAILLYDRKLGIPAMVLAGLITFSRLYLYVHYPTDVLFSAVLGICLAFLARYAVERGYRRLKT